MHENIALKQYTITDTANRECYIYFWHCKGVPPRGIIQLSHGMSEHIYRYVPFAEYLCSNGYAVCGSDHPGHGLNSNKNELGYFGKSGYTGTVDRLYSVSRFIKNLYPGVPLILFGHSMGSLMARKYLTVYGDEISAAIISGTIAPNPLNGIGITFVNILSAIKSDRAKSDFIKHLMFGSYNKRTEKKSEFSWLTRDFAEIEKYDNDEYCGFDFTLNGYSTLFSALKDVSSMSWAKSVPKNLPILIISGTDDPVGGYGKGVKKVADMLRKANVYKLQFKLFEGYRHELLKEFGREEVYKVILDFINSVIDKK